MLPDHVASQKAESAWTAMLSECSCPGGPLRQVLSIVGILLRQCKSQIESNHPIPEQMNER